MVVIAPLALIETVVTTEKDPVAQGGREAVWRGYTVAGKDL